MSRLISVFAVSLVALVCGAATAGAASAPGVRTGGSSAVTPQTATIHGTVNPNGVPTAFYFQFGTSKSYRSRTTTGDAGAGNRSVAVTATLSGLRPHATYHYRVVGFSTAGTRHGADRTFKTPQIPTTSTISVVPNPVVFGAPVTVSGTLTGPGIGGQKVALQGNPAPFTGFQQVGNTLLTTPVGSYTFVMQPQANTQLRVVDLSKPTVTSPIVTVFVAPRVSVRWRRSRRGGGLVRFSGRVTPSRVGNPVFIQRRTRKGWATVAITLTRAKRPSYSVFGRRVRLHRAGRYRVLVKTTAGDYVDGASRSVRIRRV